MKKKSLIIILLFLIFALALFLRVYFSYDKVFSNQIRYSADDGVYHMRLVENELLGNHFPSRIYFDPYTYFPYGTYHYFAPLYDQLLAGIIFIYSFGKPSLEAINKVAPFYPAFLGSLMVFLIYFIGKKIWDNKVGLFSAFLMAISPPYLYRSLLGATDHHVAEVLFSTLAVMFLIFGLRARNIKMKNGKEQNEKTKIERVKWEINQNRNFWFFILLTGISLGLYFLTWTGALLFLFIIFLFVIFYYLIEYLSGSSPDWILFAGIIIFLIVFLMIIPFLGHPDLFHSNLYSIKHLLSLVLGISGFIFLILLGNFIERRRINYWFLPIFLIFFATLFLIFLKFIVPFLFEELIESFRAINLLSSPYKSARELTSEMRPLSLDEAYASFGALFFLSFIILAIIFYEFARKRRPEYLLILIWTIVIILMTGIIPLFGQKRFIYYLSFNISLLSGFFIVRGFQFGWQGLKIAQRFRRKSLVQPYFSVGSLLIIFNVVFFLLFPFPFNIGKSFPENLPQIFQAAIETAKEGIFIRDEDWYDTLKWLKENTPEPGIDYYALYQEPGINTKTGDLNPYPYPKEAYGVLASWSLGHEITFYAHRIPNSNPFHQGIGQKKGEEILEVGEVVFFLETEEEKAISYLEKLKTKYIITNYGMIIPEGEFKSKIKWIQGNLEDYLANELSIAPSKFDNSMAVRLHVLDGRETTTEREVNGKKIEFLIKPLDHFRLVYESKRKVISSPQRPENAVNAFKIFEYVKGAKIVGVAPPDQEVSISTEITTNQGRKFIYEKKTIAENGNFEFILPYSTFGKDGWLENGTKFAVFASPYRIKFGEIEKIINVSEKEVIEGREIKVDF